MKKIVKFALCALVASLFFAVAAGAHAAEISVSNALDIRLSLTFTYHDRESGELTTKGWWYVEPHGQTVVTLDADESRDIYYAAFNKDQFVDTTTRNNPQIWRWASYRNFSFTTEEDPSDPDVWKGRFFKINGTSINVDGKRRG
ncbi:DUF1036 domain-containing protein [Synergistaceae bacterium OttesenSCG-928-I11]|nr:DUF1036 domain-containing protein [Synergistaceae bacterium OttesenSCG-928-I11]